MIDYTDLVDLHDLGLKWTYMDLFMSCYKSSYK